MLYKHFLQGIVFLDLACTLPAQKIRNSPVKNIVKHNFSKRIKYCIFIYCCCTDVLSQVVLQKLYLQKKYAFKYMFYALPSMYWTKKADVQQGCVLKLGHLCCLISIGENVQLKISAYSPPFISQRFLHSFLTQVSWAILVVRDKLHIGKVLLLIVIKRRAGPIPLKFQLSGSDDYCVSYLSFIDNSSRSVTWNIWIPA